MILGAQCSGCCCCCFCLRAEPNQPNVRLHVQLRVSICPQQVLIFLTCSAAAAAAAVTVSVGFLFIYCNNACLELLQWGWSCHSESLWTLHCDRCDLSPYRRFVDRTSLSSDTERTRAADSRRNVVPARNINLRGPS